jgi:hypothetical protein
MPSKAVSPDDFQALAQEKDHYDKMRARAGEALLHWLDQSYEHDFDTDNESSDVRAEQNAYARGYNDCRTSAFTALSSVIYEDPTKEKDDKSCDCGCSCCE